MADVPKCPQCGNELPGGALGGICPKCLGRVVFGMEGRGRAKLQGSQLQAEPREGEVGNPEPSEPKKEIGTLKMDAEAVAALESVGIMVGRYKLLQKIGEGGFGIVYMAEQVAPVQRKVALQGGVKVIWVRRCEPCEQRDGLVVID